MVIIASGVRRLGTGLLLTVGTLACGDDGGASVPAESSGGSTSVSTTSSGSEAGPGPSSSTEPDPDPDTGSSESTGGPCSQSVDPGPPVAWPSFNLDGENSRFNASEAALTPDNLDCMGRRWTVEGLTAVTSTPAVVDGLVYIGDWDGTVHAFSADDGDAIWATDVATQVNDSPLVADGRVFVADNTGNVHALDAGDGELLWSAEVDPHDNASLYSSPVLAGDVIVLGVSSVELALSKADYTFRGSVVALDPATGEEAWRFYVTEDDLTSGAGVSVWSSAAVDSVRGHVYIGTGNTYEEPAAPLSDSLIAIDYSNGDLVWSHQFTAGDVYVVPDPQGPDADVGAAPNLFVADGTDAVGVGDKAGVYSVLDRDSGDLLWDRQLTEGAPLGGVMSVAAVDDTSVYVASNAWVSTFDFDDPANTAVVFALDRDDGAIRWEAPSAAPVFGALSVAGGLLYHTTVTGELRALDVADGTELWTDEPGADVAGGFTIANGRLYVGYGFWFFTVPPDTGGGLIAYGLPG